MGIITELLEGGDESGNRSETVKPEEKMREPVHEWFSEEAYSVARSGGGSVEDPGYSQALEEMDPLGFRWLDSAEMQVTEDMRDLIHEGYRIVELDNGEESLRVAYLSWDDNIDEAFGELLGQATYRTEDNEAILPEDSIERAVETMYDAVQEINEELREEDGVDVIGGRRNSTVKASSRASRYDSRRCMNNNSMIGWGNPGVSSHIGFSIKNVSQKDLPYGAKNHVIQGKVEDEVKDRLDYYRGRKYDVEESVREIGEKFRQFLDESEEIEVTVERKHRTGSVDRIMMDDTQVYDGEKFTYETIDWSQRKRGGGRDRGLREFDRIAEVIEGEEVHSYQEA